jgi:hypothetical protein
LGLFFPIYGKVKNVPNHQPVLVVLLGRMNCMLPALPWIGYCLEVRNCSATDAVADEVADGWPSGMKCLTNWHLTWHGKIVWLDSDLCLVELTLADVEGIMFGFWVDFTSWLFMAKYPFMSIKSPCESAQCPRLSFKCPHLSFTSPWFLLESAMFLVTFNPPKNKTGGHVICFTVVGSFSRLHLFWGCYKSMCLFLHHHVCPLSVFWYLGHTW